MKILAIETSTMLGGVAIAGENRGLIAETRLNVKTTHSERLMIAVHNTLLQSDLSLDDIDVYGVAIGPGSFTGLRIGLSTVKGLSYATGKPLVTVPTLDAFAMNFPCSVYPVCLMLDARKNEVYAAVFEWSEGRFEKVYGEITARPDNLLGQLKEKILFAGEGALLYQNIIRESLGERAVFASPEKMVPSPANVAVLGLSRAQAGEYTDAATAVPLYIRKSEAEVKWLEMK